MAFTLIELLAVIVILAIIALIATPIILGIVEDARRDAFLRSVELVISSTDLDVMNKLTDTGYEYEIIDGSIIEEKEFVGYEIVDVEACIDFEVAEWGYSEEEATSECNNEPQDWMDGLTLTEYLKDAPDEASMYIEAGAVEEIYNYNDLNLAKNTEGMNGIITYDKDGKEVYAIHNDMYCVKRKANMDKAIISDYIEGECNVNLTFQEFLDLNPSEGDKITSGKGQLIHLGKYGIRYQGSNPDNYAYFNCSDSNNQNSDTCELWRIIGVVDEKVKIIRAESIGEMAWDDPDGVANNGDEDNNWTDSTLQVYLNGETEGNYYASLQQTSKNMIQTSDWYLRSGTEYINTYEAYDMERTTGTIWYETEKVNKNIGLLYVSDIGFGLLPDTDCDEDDVFSCYTPSAPLWVYGFFADKNWLDIGEEQEWLITPGRKANTAFSYPVHQGTGVYGLNDETRVSYAEVIVRPTLYLKNNVIFSNGNGTLENPYQLTLEEN